MVGTGGGGGGGSGDRSGGRLVLGIKELPGI